MQNAGGILTEELQNLLKIETECATLQMGIHHPATDKMTAYSDPSGNAGAAPSSSGWADPSNNDIHPHSVDSASGSAVIHAANPSTLE